MHSFGHRIERHQTPNLCRGCVSLVVKPSTEKRDRHKCELSGKTTHPTRTACILWAKD